MSLLFTVKVNAEIIFQMVLFIRNQNVAFRKNCDGSIRKFKVQFKKIKHLEESIFLKNLLKIVMLMTRLESTYNFETCYSGCKGGFCAMK